MDSTSLNLSSSQASLDGGYAQLSESSETNNTKSRYRIDAIDRAGFSGAHTLSDWQSLNQASRKAYFDEQIIFEIWTNGAISPEKVLEYALSYSIALFQKFILSSSEY